MRVRELVVVGALALGANSSSAIAGPFEGWCFPANACTGEPSPIIDDRYDRCEDRCTLQNPVPVRGLAAQLYDVHCERDSGNSEFRMFLAEYREYDGTVRALAVDESGVTQLEPCATR
jgi:hypothetical protein